MSDEEVFYEWENEACRSIDPQYPMVRLRIELRQEYGQITQRRDFMLSLRDVQSSLRAIARSRALVRGYLAARGAIYQGPWSPEVNRYEDLHHALTRFLNNLRIGVESLQAFQYEQERQGTAGRANSSYTSRQYTANLLRGVRAEIAQMRSHLHECEVWLLRNQLRRAAGGQRPRSGRARGQDNGRGGAGAQPNRSRTEQDVDADRNPAGQDGGEQRTANGGGRTGIGAPGTNYGDGRRNRRRPLASRRNSQASNDSESEGSRGRRGGRPGRQHLEDYEEPLPDFEEYEDNIANDDEANRDVRDASLGPYSTASMDTFGNLRLPVHQTNQPSALSESDSANASGSGEPSGRSGLEHHPEDNRERERPTIPAASVPQNAVPPSDASNRPRGATTDRLLREYIRRRDFATPANQAYPQIPQSASQVPGASRTPGPGLGAFVGAGDPGDPNNPSSGGSGGRACSKGCKRHKSDDDDDGSENRNAHSRHAKRRQQGPHSANGSPTSPISPNEVHQQGAASAAEGTAMEEGMEDPEVDELLSGPKALQDYLKRSVRSSNGIREEAGGAVVSIVRRLRKAHGDDWFRDSAPPITDFLTADESGEAMRQLRVKESYDLHWEELYAQLPNDPYSNAIKDLLQVLQADLQLPESWMYPPRGTQFNVGLLEKFRREIFIGGGATVEDNWTMYWNHVQRTQGDAVAKKARLAYEVIQAGLEGNSQPRSPPNPRDRGLDPEDSAKNSQPRSPPRRRSRRVQPPGQPPGPPPIPPRERRDSSRGRVPIHDLPGAAAEAQKMDFLRITWWRWLWPKVVKETYIPRVLWNDQRFWQSRIDPADPPEERYPRELHLHSLLQNLHQSFNIVRATGSAVYSDKHMYRLYMEYCEHGDLENLIRNHKDLARRQPVDQEGNLMSCNIPTSALWCIFEALISVACLMQNGRLPDDARGLPTGWEGPIFHRDIKPHNVFLAKADDQSWKTIPLPKLGDFGIATQREAKYLRRRPSQADVGLGTPGYVAPEAFPYDPLTGIQNHKYSSASDVYTIGQTMMCLMNLTSVAEVEQYDFLHNRNLPAPNAKAVEVYPETLINLVLDCVKPHPHDRAVVETLWWEIRREVTEFPQGLTGLPLKLRILEKEDILRYAPDHYAAWAK